MRHKTQSEDVIFDLFYKGLKNRNFLSLKMLLKRGLSLKRAFASVLHWAILSRSIFVYFRALLSLENYKFYNGSF